MVDFGISAEEFIADYYERKLWIRRGAFTGYPVSWKDINTALFSWDPSDGLLQLFKNGPVPAERYVERFADLSLHRTKIVKEAFYLYMREGATLVLNRLETKLEPVHDLAMEIARFVGEKAVANGYAAFGGEGTFARHWDTHDVFAVQLIGRKHWRVFPPTFELPLAQQKSKLHKQECPSRPVFDGILEAGDILYIPRGWWHEAIPLPEEETFHIAVGVHPMFLRDYIAWSCFNTLPTALALRQSIKAESAEMPGIVAAAKIAGELICDEENVAAYKRELFFKERVVSRFSLETLGRRGNSVEKMGQFRLNSAYKTKMPSAAQPVVNGQVISVDRSSGEHLAKLFSQPETAVESISVSAEQQSKIEALFQHLTAHDIVSPVFDGSSSTPRSSKEK